MQRFFCPAGRKNFSPFAKPISFEKIGGTLTINGQSSEVSGVGAGSNLEITNSYKYVILKRAASSIEVRGDSSRIEVSQIEKLPANGRINLFTTYKPVTQALPASAPAQISARTEYGKIRSDFPVYLNDSEGKTLKTAIGTGGTVVQIETSGDIVLRRSEGVTKG